jgi:hypothetical protein
VLTWVLHGLWNESVWVAVDSERGYDCFLNDSLGFEGQLKWGDLTGWYNLSKCVTYEQYEMN